MSAAETASSVQQVTDSRAGAALQRAALSDGDGTRPAGDRAETQSAADQDLVSESQIQTEEVAA